LMNCRTRATWTSAGLNSVNRVLKELVRNLFLFCYARALRPAQNLASFTMSTLTVERAARKASTAFTRNPRYGRPSRQAGSYR
jgi:hypothetical protein